MVGCVGTGAVAVGAGVELGAEVPLEVVFEVVLGTGFIGEIGGDFNVPKSLSAWAFVKKIDSREKLTTFNILCKWAAPKCEEKNWRKKIVKNQKNTTKIIRLNSTIIKKALL